MSTDVDGEIVGPVKGRWGSVAYRLLVVALIGVGVYLYLVSQRYGTRQWRLGEDDRKRDLRTLVQAVVGGIMVAVAGALVARSSSAMAGMARRIGGAIARPGARTRWWVALLLACVSATYLYSTARRQGHDLNLRIHDENMYMVQAQLLAHGHLWMPQHALPEFFESFHVYARPVYGSMYFPGTGLFYAIPVRLGVPTWVFSLALSGLAVGLVYLVVTELLGGVSGLLAAGMTVAIDSFRYFSVMLMSHTLLMALGTLMVLAVLRWRGGGHRVRWLIVLGAAAGWAAIARPVDAACYAAPLGVVVLWEMRKLSWRARVRTVAITVAAAAPFLALQLVMNYGFTGHVTRSPVQAYLDTYWPEMQMGKREAQRAGPGVIFPRASMGMAFEGVSRTIRWWEHQTIRPRLAERLPNRLPQFADFYLDFVLPAVHTFQETPTDVLIDHRVRTTILGALPSSGLAILLPVSLVGLWGLGRLALGAVPVIFFTGYLFFAFYLDHYVLVVAPALIFLCLLGARGVVRAAAPLEALAGPFVAVLVLFFTLKGLPEFNPGDLDQPAEMVVLQAVNARLAALPANERALVFFRYHPEEAMLWKQEPVYTLDAAYPDEARIVRAHDLGARNADLIAYYARIQPDRRVYVFDLQTREMTPLGVVKDLAAKKG